MHGREMNGRHDVVGSLVAFLLVVWEPLSFAVVASGSLRRLAIYGAPAWLLLICRVLVTGYGVAAGRAVWHRDSSARTMVSVWAALAAVATVVTSVTPYFPSNRLPGMKAPLLVLTLAYYAAVALGAARTTRLPSR